MNPQRDVELEDFSSRLLARLAHGVAAGFAFPVIVPASALGRGGRVAPSNRITLGVIGTGNQGFNDINSFLKDERVQIVAVCDVNRESAGYWEGKVGGREPAQTAGRGALRQAQAFRYVTAAAMPVSTSGKSWAGKTSTRSRSAPRTTGTRFP